MTDRAPFDLWYEAKKILLLPWWKLGMPSFIGPVFDGPAVCKTCPAPLNAHLIGLHKDDFVTSCPTCDMTTQPSDPGREP